MAADGDALANAMPRVLLHERPVWFAISGSHVHSLRSRRADGQRISAIAVHARYHAVITITYQRLRAFVKASRGVRTCKEYFVRFPP